MSRPPIGWVRGAGVLAATSVVVAVLMMGLDLLFLGVLAKPFYDAQLGALRAPAVHWPAALAFYLFYVLAIALAAVLPARRPGEAARRGALLGGFGYTVYELTNWAVITGWPGGLVPVDIAWGIALTGTVAGVSRAAVHRWVPGGDGWMRPSPVHRFDGEGALSIWARRAVSFTVIGLLSVTALLGAPLFLLGFGLADLVLGPRGRWTRTRAWMFFTWYLACELVGLLAAFVVWAATLEGRLVGDTRYADYHFALQARWTSALFYGALQIFGMRLEVEGAASGAAGPYVVWVRHVSTADTVLAASVLANPHRIQLRYVVKRDLLWDPCLDVVGRRLPSAFIRRESQDPSGAIAAVARLAEDLAPNAGVLIYPEGTRYSAARHARALERLEARDETDLLEIAQQMQHVLPPRLGGVLALMETAPDVDIVTVAHTGLEGARSFREFWSGGLVGGTIRVRIERHTVPAEVRDAPARWVYARWTDIDRWVDAQTS